MPMVAGAVGVLGCGCGPSASSCPTRKGLDLSHRKSAMTAGEPNEHPPRVLPATTRRPQPRFFQTSRPDPRSCMSVADMPCDSIGRSEVSCGRSGGAVELDASRPGPGARWGRCFLAWLSALAVVRAERRGAAGAVAETRSGGGPGPPARAARRRRAALIQ